MTITIVYLECIRSNLACEVRTSPIVNAQIQRLIFLTITLQIRHVFVSSFTYNICATENDEYVYPIKSANDGAFTN